MKKLRKYVEDLAVEKYDRMGDKVKRFIYPVDRIYIVNKTIFFIKEKYLKNIHWKTKKRSITSQILLGLIANRFMKNIKLSERLK